MKLIGLCGKIGAGKDALADYVVKKHKYNKIVMSDIITEELKTNGRPVNREEMQKITREYKANFGKGVWAKKSIEYARKKGWRRVAITGIRDSEEVKVFRRELGKDFLLVCVTADDNIRCERLKSRGSAKDIKTLEEFEAQEKKEAEIFDLYDKFEKIADVVLTNNTSMIEFFAKVELLLKEKDFKAKEI
jgi:dephospho-CoA kinase